MGMSVISGEQQVVTMVISVDINIYQNLKEQIKNHGKNRSYNITSEIYLNKKLIQVNNGWTKKNVTPSFKLK